MVALTKRLQQSTILFLLLLGNGGCGTPIEFNLDLAPPPFMALVTDTNATILDKLHQASARLLTEADAVGERCKQTHGLWRPFLHSCRCPSKKVFFVEHGCIEPQRSEFSELFKIQKAMENPEHSPKLSLENKTIKLFSKNNQHLKVNFPIDIPLKQLIVELQADAFQIVKDISFVDKNSELIQIITILPSSTTLVPDSLAWYGPRNASTADQITSIFYLDIRSLDNPDYAQELQKEDCIAGLSKALDHRFFYGGEKLFSDSVEKFCEDTINAVAFIVQPDKQHQVTSLPMMMRSFQPNCQVNCTKTFDFLIRNTRFSSDIFMKDFIATQRRITLELENDFWLQIMLSPNGSVLQIILDEVALNRSGGYAAYKANKTILNGKFEIIKQNSMLLGNLKKMQEFLSPKPLGWILPSDSNQNIIEKKIGATIINQAFMLHQSLFNKRVAFNQDALQSILSDIGSNKHLFTGEKYDFSNYTLNHFPDLHEEQNSEHKSISTTYAFYHGNSVASIVMNDLPNIGIDLVGTSEYDVGSSDPKLSAHKLCERINNHKSRVVVIPYATDHYLSRCAEYYHGLALECNKVLFIASSGNIDGELVGASCPSGLDFYLDNFIFVAGVSPLTRRLDGAVYSKQQITIAAPMTAPCLNANFQRDSCSGTSFAAPAIANAVLHLLTRRPELSPKEVIFLLKKYCHQDRLNLICGGALNFEKFFKQEIKPYSQPTDIILDDTNKKNQKCI